VRVGDEEEDAGGGKILIPENGREQMKQRKVNERLLACFGPGGVNIYRSLIVIM
jgi:hypothetical protein